MAATPRPGIGSHRWMGLKSIRLPLREIVNKLGATRSRESTRYLRATDLLPLPPPCVYMCACFVAPHTRAVYRDSLARMRESSEITQRGRRTSYELNKDTRIPRVRFAEGWKEKGSRVGRRTQTRDQHTNVAFINARCTVGFAGTASAVRQPARQGQVFLSILLRSSPFSSCPFNLSADRCVPPFCAYLLPPPRLCTPTLLPATPLVLRPPQRS